MWSARFLSHINHVSVSPTDGNGPTQGQRKTLTRVGIEPTTFGLDLRRSTDWENHIVIMFKKCITIKFNCDKAYLNMVKILKTLLKPTTHGINERFSFN